MNLLLDLVRRHKQAVGGHVVGIPSVCTAQEMVIETTLRECAAARRPALIEATCNQVNQEGGYTGLTPRDFAARVRGIAAESGLDPSLLALGGDHLGPNPWRSRTAADAMDRAQTMVAHYVAAGFRKIHLDCSMACRDDPARLPEEEIAARAVRLCRAAEQAWRESADGSEAPVYVIGTEVPVPGGAHEALQTLEVTTPEAAWATVHMHQEAFRRAGLEAAWERVIALVVQPGVEFDHHKVIDYQPERARALSRFIEQEPRLVYEAHSTDYQTPDKLARLAADHFAVLKVGPGLTFAWRETLWSLDAIDRAWSGRGEGLAETVLHVMRAEPDHWAAYYRDRQHLDLDLAFSLSDRIRYYWAHPLVRRACESLLARLDAAPPPLTLLSQFLPRQYEAIREGRLSNCTRDLLREGTALALRPYYQACEP